MYKVQTINMFSFLFRAKQPAYIYTSDVCYFYVPFYGCLSLSALNNANCRMYLARQLHSSHKSTTSFDVNSLSSCKLRRQM